MQCFKNNASSKNPTETDQLQDQGGDGRIIVILQKQEGGEWIHLAQDRSGEGYCEHCNKRVDFHKKTRISLFC
jgi:hypothetical protein